MRECWVSREWWKETWGSVLQAGERMSEEQAASLPQGSTRAVVASGSTGAQSTGAQTSSAPAKKALCATTGEEHASALPAEPSFAA